MMKKTEKKRLGDLLIEAGLITPEQLKKGLEEQKKTGERIGHTLVKLGFIAEKNAIVLLSKQLGIAYHVDLDGLEVPPELAGLIPFSLIEKHHIIPLRKAGNNLTLAMVDPLNVFVIDEIQRLTKCIIKPAICTKTFFLEAIEKYYKTGQSNTQTALRKTQPLGKQTKTETTAETTQIVKLLDTIVQQAVKDRASDIHIEPDEDKLRIRFRIDGMLHEVKTMPLDLHAMIISRVKILSALDISEKRVPQDGRFQMKTDQKEIDFRVSTLPTVWGEKIVMRILDKSMVLNKLETVGFSADHLKSFNSIIRKAYGIILVTGPTSSGKTTTLYSSLNEINSLDKNIITVEDPVEYRLKLINQVQVNTKVGLTFARTLRSILRQDPDVLMVGEIRDTETAEIAVQAALTGHLVFSTIHTNNAPGTLTRLLDMKIEPFLIASAVICILAQRLVRTICKDCKEPYTPTPQITKDLGLSNEQEKIIFYQGKGCSSCKQTGYRGRLGIFELLLIDDNIKPLIINRASATEIKRVAQQFGMRTLRADGLEKARQGLVTLEEVLRVTAEE